MSDLHSVKLRGENKNRVKTIRVTKHWYTVLWVPAKLQIIPRGQLLDVLCKKDFADCVMSDCNLELLRNTLHRHPLGWRYNYLLQCSVCTSYIQLRMSRTGRRNHLCSIPWADGFDLVCARFFFCVQKTQEKVILGFQQCQFKVQRKMNYIFRQYITIKCISF